MRKERTDRQGNSAVQHEIFDGRLRTIFEPVDATAKDQLQQLATTLSKFLYSHPRFRSLDKDGVVHGFVPKRSTSTHARVHKDAVTIVQLDLYRAFDFTKRDMVASALEDLGPPKNVQEQVDRQAFLFDALPAGFPTSPVLFNAGLLRADEELLALAREKDLRYSRYADDLVFSSEQVWVVQEAIDAIRQVLVNYGYDSHKVRVGHPTKTPTVICGVGIFRGRVMLPGKEKRRIRSALHHSLAQPPKLMIPKMGGLLGRVKQAEGRIPESLAKYKMAFVRERNRVRRQNRRAKKKR